MAVKCTHIADHVKNVKPRSKGCEECLKTGDTWVHLRMCLECGSAERGEDWRWCYIDDTYL
ncbi:MAG: hypothetical protein ABSF17_19130 [Terracidiphilus sp.]